MERVSISESCEILDSRRIPITAKDRKPGPYPYYGANGVQDYVSDYIFDDELVLVAEDGGNFGSKERPIAYRVSGKCWVNNHAHVLKPLAGLDVDYLCCALMFYDVGGLVNGATRMKLTQAALRQMTIPSRAVEEQRSIVKQIAAVKSIIQKRNEELTALDDLIKARFVEMFGEPISNSQNLPTKRLGEICELQAGDFTPADAIHEEPDQNNCYPCYGGNGIRGYVDNYTQEGVFPIIGRQGALCGNVQLAHGKFRNTEHAVLVTPKTQLNVVWLFELLRLENLYRFHTGAAQPGLAVKTLNQVVIPFASVQLQNQYADFFTQIDKSKFWLSVLISKIQDIG